MYFDTDSAPVGIDNRCSACHTIKEFHGKTKTRQAIQGYGGVEVYVYKGTLKWKIEDDKGRHHHLHSRSYYRPKSDARLISPQHWAQKLTRKDKILTKHAILTELSAGHFMTERL
jgi:hypothetical protein